MTGGSYVNERWKLAKGSMKGVLICLFTFKEKLADLNATAAAPMYDIIALKE